MKPMIAAVVLVGLGGVSACSTLAGFGEDVSAAGRGISHLAAEVGDELASPRAASPATQRQTAALGDTCDPHARLLAGGGRMPPCPGKLRGAPVPTTLKRPQ